jgi:hypothetical protein
MPRTAEEHARSIVSGVALDIDKRVRDGFMNDERDPGPEAASAQHEALWRATVAAITAEFNREYTPEAR